jgi:N-acetylmuramoyl-L-alanine amidase
MRKKIIISFVLCLLFIGFFSNKATAGTTPARIYADSPTSGQTIKTSFAIVGWALNASGVKGVAISIDGVKQAAVTTGLSRTDVDKAFPGYPGGATSGFSSTVNIDAIAPGTHTILVQATGNDGSVSSVSYQINISKAAPRMYVDSPTSGQTIKISFVIAGWALNASGIKEVDISIDGVKQGTATTGLSRPDVDKAFPGYRGGVSSGFNYPVDITSIKPGIHSINVQAIGNDGTSTSFSYKINIYKAPPGIYADSPTSGQTIKTSFAIVGWALNASGVKGVAISIDGVKQAAVTTGLSRTDVDKAFPGYPGGATSGFSYGVDINTITLGTHTILVQATGNDGSVSSVSYKINPVVIVIDAGHGGTDSGAVGPHGTKEKDINLDIAKRVNIYLQAANYNVIMTRTADTTVALEDRPAIANANNASLLVSIHCDAYTDPSANGTGTYYEWMKGNPVYANQADSRRLAGLVQTELLKALGLANRGVNEDGLCVCRETNAPACLVETAFISNPQEEQLLNDPNFRERAAEAIGRGIIAYF